MIKLNEARKMLPNFARGLGIYAKSTNDLIASVKEELLAYHEGENPLDPKQVAALRSFLRKVQP